MFLVWSYFPVFGQVTDSTLSSENKNLSKEEKKAMKKAEEEKTAKMVKEMVDNRLFVMEAHYVYATGGTRTSVNPTTNYIELNGNNITIQLSSTAGIGGPNGMGGVTADGTISKFTVTPFGKKKDGYNIDIITMTLLGTLEVFMSVYPNGNADASVGGNRVGKVNFQGLMVPYEKAKTFKGMHL
jgi:hypothetical protein